MQRMPDLYAALGVSRQATTDEIRSAYKTRSLQHHPDRPTGNEAKFKEIQEAHEVLSDERRRAVYDQTGSIQEGSGPGPGFPGFPGFPGGNPMTAGGIPFSFMGGGGFGIPEVHFDMGDMFNGLFGGGAGKPRRRGGKGPNKFHDIGVRIQDFYKGHEIKLKFNQARKCAGCGGSGAEATETCGPCGGAGRRMMMRPIGPNMIAQTQVDCEVCSGEGKRVMRVCRGCQGKKFMESEKQLEIKVVPGMRDGQKVPFVGECSDSLEYDEPGDVVLTLQCAGLPEAYEWKGDDLWVTTSITYAESVLGFTKTFADHPSGKEVVVTWQGGPLLHGAILCREGLGMPFSSKEGYGALFLRIHIIPPPVVPWSSDDAAKLQSVLGGVAASLGSTGQPLEFYQPPP
jgi:DnaJ-class molecular chaperone